MRLVSYSEAPKGSARPLLGGETAATREPLMPDDIGSRICRVHSLPIYARRMPVTATGFQMFSGEANRHFWRGRDLSGEDANAWQICDRRPRD